MCWSIIHMPWNLPFWSVQLSVFQYIDNIVHLSPLWNSRMLSLLQIKPFNHSPLRRVTYLLSVCRELPILDISYKRSRTICGFVCLHCLTLYNIFKVHHVVACITTSFPPPFFLVNNMLFNEWTIFLLYIHQFNGHFGSFQF